jgi:hypothetical protein
LTNVPSGADIPAAVLGLQEELHQLRLGQSKDRQDIADSLARTQAIERTLYTEAEVKKFVDEAIQKFMEDALNNYVKKEDLASDVSAAGFARSADLATKEDIARFNPLIKWMCIFSNTTLESMTSLNSQIADNRERVHSLERLAVSTLTHQAMQANLAELVSGCCSPCI